MLDKSLAHKLKLKPGQRGAIIKAPDGHRKELGALPVGVELAEKLAGKFDWIQLFVKNKTELERLAPRTVQALKPESLLWISFPKGTSAVQTDLTRDKGWDSRHDAALRWVTLVSVN